MKKISLLFFICCVTVVEHAQGTSQYEKIIVFTQCPANSFRSNVAGAFSSCGGGNTAAVMKLTRPDWRVFHGPKHVVLPHLSQEMVDTLKKAGADVKLTLYPDANHNSWDPAFAEKDLIPGYFLIKNKS